MKLIDVLRKRKVREGLIERLRKILRETRSRVRVVEELWSVFGRRNRVRQVCPLSPILLIDLEKLGKVKWGKMKVGKKRIYSLAYADDVVLIGEESTLRQENLQLRVSHCYT